MTYSEWNSSIEYVIALRLKTNWLNYNYSTFLVQEPYLILKLLKKGVINREN